MTVTTSITPAKPRTVGHLAREIRTAWMVASAAVPFPPEIQSSPDVLSAGYLEDPRIATVLDARQTAFEYALGELIDGGYLATAIQLRALRQGILPDTDMTGEEAGNGQ